MNNEQSWHYNEFDMEQDDDPEDVDNVGDSVAPFNMGNYGTKMEKLDILIQKNK